MPEFTVAVVVTFDSAIPTLGTTATLPPAAPVLECVARKCDVFAVSVRLPPPLSWPSSDAVVRSSTIATATDAPMPTDPTPVTPDSFGKASTLLVACEAAAIVTSPVPAVRTPAMTASVSMFSMSIATEPAMPTEPPPAPLVALAPSSSMPPESAWIVAPCEMTVASTGRTARFKTRT